MQSRELRWSVAACVVIGSLLVPGRGQSPWTSTVIAVSTAFPRGVDFAIDTNGARHCLFYVDATTGGRGLMRHARRDAGVSWSSAIVTDVAGNAASRPRLAIAADHTVYVARAADEDLSERVYANGSGVFLPVGAPLPSGDFWKGGMGGAVAVDAQGFPVLAYFFGPTEDARFARFDGLQWQEELVEAAGRPGKTMELCALGGGGFAAAYYHQDEHQVHVAIRDPANGWSAPTAIGTGDAMDIQEAADLQLHVLRRNEAAGTMHLHSSAGGSFIEDLGFPGALLFEAKIALAPDGTVHVVGQTTTGEIVYCRRSGGTWTRELVSTSGYGPAIALTVTGDPVLAYARPLDGTIVESERNSLPAPLLALDFAPSVVSLASTARWVNGHLYVYPEGLAASIPVASVRITRVDGVAIPPLFAASGVLRDMDGDLVEETLRVRFRRADVLSLVPLGFHLLTIEGALGSGQPFAVVDALRVVP